VSNYRFNFPELYQFFGGYFYQGWSSDYRWDSAKPNFVAVILHFKAVNPPITINKVCNELQDLLNENLDEAKLSNVLTELGNNFYPESEQLSHRQWLEKIKSILNDSPTRAKILRELR
jgi:CdiI immunity protein